MAVEVQGSRASLIKLIELRSEVSAARKPVLAFIEKYSEDQARDELGRWTNEGGALAVEVSSRDDGAGLPPLPKAATPRVQDEARAAGGADGAQPGAKIPGMLGKDQLGLDSAAPATEVDIAMHAYFEGFERAAALAGNEDVAIEAARMARLAKGRLRDAGVFIAEDKGLINAPPGREFDTLGYLVRKHEALGGEIGDIVKDLQIATVNASQITEEFEAKNLKWIRNAIRVDNTFAESVMSNIDPPGEEPEEPERPAILDRDEPELPEDPDPNDEEAMLRYEAQSRVYDEYNKAREEYEKAKENYDLEHSEYENEVAEYEEKLNNAKGPLSMWFDSADEARSEYGEDIGGILEDAPNFSGIVMRGVRKGYSYDEGDEVEIDGARSYTRDAGVAADFADLRNAHRGAEDVSRSLIIMEAKTAVSVEDFENAISSEREVIVRPGTRARVERVVRFGNSSVYFMKEMAA